MPYEKKYHRVAALGQLGRAALLALALASGSCIGLAQEKSTAGVAVKYPGDTGIEQDPTVIFAENFEEPSLDAMKKR